MSREPTRPFGRDHLSEGVVAPDETDPRRLGPYEVVGRIGAGGMGAVYAGISDTGACAAVKVVHPHIAVDPEFLSRFQREVNLVSQVRASCTPEFLGAEVTAETPWLATEYVPGLTLRAHVKKHGPLSGGMLTALAVGLAEALVAIHAAGVVHRDLKPGNVILAPDGPKVLDFGIARVAGGTTLTRTGGLMGTLGWIAPEQYVGEEASEASDMFAWAGLVLFAATGREPFGRGPVDVVSHRTRTEEPDLTGLPAESAETLRVAFSKDARQRPRAMEVLDGLTSGWRERTRLGPTPEQEAPTEIVPELLAQEWGEVEIPAVRRPRRSRGLWWSAAAAGVTAVGFLSAWLVVDPAPDVEGSGSEAGDSETGEGDEPQGSHIGREPEEVDTVIGEALDLVRGADSFTAVSHRGSNAPGDTTPYYHWYTEDPEPAFLSLSMLGPVGGGHVAYGEGLEEIVGVSERREGSAQGPGREYYRGGQQQEVDSPLGEWEHDLESLQALQGDGAELSYEGTGAVPAPNFALEEVAGEVDLASRNGHRYSGSVTGDFWMMPGPTDPPGGEQAEVELWVSDEGYPQKLSVTETFEVDEEEWDVEVLENTYDLDLVSFNEPVEIEIPDESEIEQRP